MKTLNSSTQTLKEKGLSSSREKTFKTRGSERLDDSAVQIVSKLQVFPSKMTVECFHVAFCEDDFEVKWPSQQ